MPRDIEMCNDYLDAQLGREQNKPRYRWEFSENLYIPMRKKTDSGGLEFDYKANESGLIVAVPVFELRKMAPHLYRQWVLCKWLDPGPEDQWLKIFGPFVEYPRNGYYAPTNIELDEGISPADSYQGRTMTQWLIEVVRKDSAKTIADLREEGEAIVARQEKAKDAQLDEIIGSVLLPFGKEPGTRSGGVSLPSTESTKNWDNTFSASTAKDDQ